VAPAERAFAGNDRSAARWYAAQPGWWSEHYEAAARQVSEFLADDGIATTGTDILDLGCGDGIISLGLLRHARAASVTGMDLVPVDLGFLSEQAVANGVEAPRPEEHLHFCVSSTDEVPAPTGSYDIVTAWSVFEHVSEPVNLLRELHRVLRADGLLFIQIWPMWHSEHGSHLWPWFDDTFVQLRMGEDQISHRLHERIEDPGLATAMLDLFRSCNRISVNDLQRALLGAGFFLAKVEISGASFHVPAELQSFPLTKLGIDGIKILAVRH
jgi:ubiquinone/menaquinone biosynthesis C-methylase UbiE